MMTARFLRRLGRRWAGLGLNQAFRRSVLRLNPLYQAKNPVMFVVYACAVLVTFDLFIHGRSERVEPFSFVLWVTIALWFTVLFANFAEALAEGLAEKQADLLRSSRKDVTAKLLTHSTQNKQWKPIPAQHLETGDHVLIEAGDFVPADGTVIEGIATVDESAITGESAPVIREPGDERNTVISGTRVLSDWVVIEVSSTHGESYIDRMLAMVKGSTRHKTPTETALNLFLIMTTIMTVVSCATLLPFTIFSTEHTHEGTPISIAAIATLIVCLAPTTIGGLLSPIGLSGMKRLLTARILALNGRAVEAAGDVNILLLDKTGTLTHGNRQAVRFFPASGISMQELAEAAFLSSYADQTPEGKSITDLARSHLKTPPLGPEENYTFIPFSAETRASGITIGENRAILKGATDVVESYVTKAGGHMPPEISLRIGEIARQGGTPLAVADGPRILGAIHLKDVVKFGMKDRLERLRRMGVQSVMITGDNPVTAAAIASESGVDDFIAQATPETKLRFIRSMQEDGNLVAMIGDGTNDAPALAQADVGIAMNTGTQEAKEAGNMVDLDSSPAKLLEIVEIGRQLAVTRGSLTTFSMASDISKYLAIISAIFVHAAPSLSHLNFLHLSTPYHALLAAVLFNALLILGLIPVALRGVSFSSEKPAALLRQNMLIYGIGGFCVSLVGLKAVDALLVLLQGSPA